MSVCASVDTLPVVVPAALIRVSETDLASSGFVDWLVLSEWSKGPVVFGWNDLGPALILDQGALCCRRLSSVRKLSGLSPLNPSYSKTEGEKHMDLVTKSECHLSNT